MAPTRSIAELLAIGIILRAEEAVAIVQQLIHNTSVDGDSRIAPPFGPPSPESVHVDEHGLATCRTCESTPGVSEIAILLQQLLPAGTPRVPGALRYMIARALHDVDAPPFDSIEDFSQGLARFERGDRAAVVRAMLARANSGTAERLRPVVPEDRRQRMPTASDFRRELRAADARLYAQQLALRTLPPAPPPAPERWRIGSIVAGLAVGLTLIAAGEVIHLQSLRAPEATPAYEAREATTVVLDERELAAAGRARNVSNPARNEQAATSAARLDKPKPAAKAPVRRTSPSAVRTRDGQRAPGKMDRLHLGWLRNMIAVRTEPL